MNNILYISGDGIAEPKNKWKNYEANKYITYYKKNNISKELALRIYTTHLLGREKELVLHGGGNTSLKSSISNIFNQKINISSSPSSSSQDFSNAYAITTMMDGI